MIYSNWVTLLCNKIIHIVPTASLELSKCYCKHMFLVGLTLVDALRCRTLPSPAGSSSSKWSIGDETCKELACLLHRVVDTTEVLASKSEMPFWLFRGQLHDHIVTYVQTFKTLSEASTQY